MELIQIHDIHLVFQNIFFYLKIRERVLSQESSPPSDKISQIIVFIYSFALKYAFVLYLFFAYNTACKRIVNVMTIPRSKPQDGLGGPALTGPGDSIRFRQPLSIFKNAGSAEKGILDIWRIKLIPPLLISSAARQISNWNF